MYIIIVGAGAVGSSLIKLALQNDHKVAMIESDQERAQAVLQNYDVQVFHANIAQGGILDEADADNADAIIATTGDDSANLMTMFLGKERGIKTLISMINDPQHQGMFERLGAQVLVDPEVIIAKHLYNFMDKK
ncbi:MAG TPA: NAD-binding protein [Oculatellaceae cyanobacterium]|jgi:trk system potassium uptake protein TrkA